MIKFRKLYQRHEEGVFSDALVIFARRPWVVESCDHGEQGHERVTEYKNRLQIDLWLFILRFEWHGGEEYCKLHDLRQKLNAGK